MKRLLLAVVAAPAAVAVVFTGAGAPAWSAVQGGTAGVRPADIGVARPAGSWGRAIEVPGLGALNTGGNAYVNSVSCGSAGNCAAAGYYRNGHGQRLGFVVSEEKGRWGRAMEVPGLGTLSQGDAGVRVVSCASAGNCAATGAYRDQHKHFQGFVAVERNGRWRRAFEVPGLGALNKGGNAAVNSVSCASAGNCVAAGAYTDSDRHPQGFVAVEKNGRWRQAFEVPGLGALNKGGNATVSSVSCASAGNCSAGGDYYTDAAGNSQAFVVSERNGAWGAAQEVASNLNAGAVADITSVSCATAGNCSAGGQYQDASGNVQAFVVSEADGTWASAKEVAGNLNSNGDASVFSVSCASAGNCSAGGDYDYDYQWAFVVSEKNGVWGKAINVPGLGKLAFRFTDLYSVSCASAGNCAAGGDYETYGGSQAYLVSEKNGVWGKAIEVPGLGSLNKGQNAAVTSVSCASAEHCAAAGSYTGAGHPLSYQGFLI